ncbi:F-box domain-containing protein [Mycena venus]|uniref:F-box domain-containing protein n=1 Tax=Mycena venus TaxID=2733690 RepID=A0A8H6YCQ4_9AGAR|nr:F-box domain-containing protein [Mycena venus]
METSRCSQCGALSTGPHSGQALDQSISPGTRHYTLFNSNEPPDGSELPFIHSVVSKTDGPLALLDDEISNLREKLQELEAARASLLSYRTRNSAILSPLRRMPPEVLREIFSWTLPSPMGTPSSGRFDMAQSPWVLARISSRWAAIALSTPSLWSRIVIDYPNAKVSSHYSLALVEAQLRRSQKLKIHFYGNRRADSPPQIQMFQLLSQHSARWEELSIGLTPETWPLLNALRDRLPSLARLWIQWGCPEDQIGVQSIDCFDTASSLVDVGIFNEHRFVSTLLPANQLTRYELDCPWEQHKAILKQSQNLLEARIEVGFDEGPWSDADETIGLLQLRRLYVSAPWVLQYLWAPALEGLAFAESQNRSSDILPPCRLFP